MDRKRKNKDIRLSVFGDLDGMTVGELRELLEGVSDDAVIVTEETEYHEFNCIETFLVIRRDCSGTSAIVNQSR